MDPKPFLPYAVVTTSDGHTATITRQETPMRMCTHRYLIVVTGSAGQQLDRFFAYNEGKANQSAKDWKMHNVIPHPAQR